MTSEPAQRAVPAVASPARRPLLLCAGAAGLCWAAADALLLTTPLDPASSVLAPSRVIYYVLVLAAGLLTFVPIQRLLRTPGLALEGVAGAALLCYAVAFVPPPTAPIYALPELPVYAIMIGALFVVGSAIALPFVVLLGRRLFQRRARQYDLRRARRQAHEVGAFVAGCGVLAGMQILTPIAAILVALTLVVVETLFLAYVEAVP